MYRLIQKTYACSVRRLMCRVRTAVRTRSRRRRSPRPYAGGVSTTIDAKCSAPPYASAPMRGGKLDRFPPRVQSFPTRRRGGPRPPSLDGDALRQVAGLIDVRATVDRDVVREQLEPERPPHLRPH